MLGESLYFAGNFHIMLMTVIIIIVILALMKKNEKILLWGIIVICVIAAGHIRCRNVIRNIKKIQIITQNFEDNSADIMVEGTVDNICVKKNSVYYYLNKAYVKTSDKKISIGRTILTSKKELKDVYAGNSLCAEVKVYNFNKARNEGGFDEREYYNSLKIWSRFSIKDYGKVIPDDNGNAWSKYRKWLYSLKGKMGVSIEKICGSEYQELYKGIILGDKENINSDVKELYRLSGISHILAISGLHISMIGYFIYRCMRKICGFGLSGLTAGLIVVSYGMMVGQTASVKRAVIMFLINIMADIAGRSYDIISSMSIALLILVADNPVCINNSGVKLSFMAVVGISVVYGILKEFLNIKSRFLQALLASECINIVTRPVIAMSYYEIPLYSSAANIIVIPLMSVVAVCGFMGVLACNIHIYLGKIFIYPGCMVLKMYSYICSRILTLPYAVKITGIPDNGRIIIYYAIMVLCVWGMSLHKSKNICRRIKIGITVCAMAVLFFIISYNEENVIRIKMLDVGQGDCIYISNGRDVVLTDGGSSSSKDIGTYTILPFLKANGVESVNYLIVTHSDNDHINGLNSIMEYKYNGRSYVENILLPKISNEIKDEEYTDIEEKARKEGVNIMYFEKGSEIRFSNMSIKCISPDSQMEGDKNELSMVYYLTGRNITMLFTGDMGEEGEKILLNNNLIKSADILKVGHHGSDGSCSEEFLKKVRPEVSLISCGINNSYGHPGKSTINRLNDIGSNIYITARCGQIDIKECENGFTVESFLH